MARLHRLHVFFTFAIAWLGALPAPGAEWPVPRGPSHEPVPCRYDPGLWKTVPKDFLQEAPACTLYSGINYLVETDGTVETVVHEITRLNGRKGIERLGEYRNIAYYPSYEKLTLNEARVRKADGRTAEVRPEDLQLRDLGTDYLTYDPGKQLIISFPSLEVGDAIEVKWTTRGKNPEYQGHFFSRYTFGDDQYPVVLDELRVRLPNGSALKYAAVGGKLAPTVREEGDTRTYHWKVTNRRQLPQDDHLPSKEELRLQVAFSTFASWDDVFRWKQNLRADCWNCTPEVRRIVADVTRDLKTPVEKARALTYWVRRSIRYVSMGEKHDYTPRPPAIVLANRYGDCKDQGQLLAVMLREAGLPVALATLGALDDGQVLEDVPSPWGSHAIVLVTLDGKDHWIDTTTSLAGWDFLPRDDRDRLCYVVDDKALRLVRTPAATPESNRIEQTTDVSIGPDGSCRCERTSVYHGAASLSRRDDWVEVPSGERRRLAASELQDAYPHARLRALEIDPKKLADLDEPVSARLAFEVPGHLNGEGDLEGSFTDSTAWAKLLNLTLDPDRQAPFELGSPFESVHTYRFKLPPAYRLADPPQNRTVRAPWGSFEVTVKVDPATPRRLEAVLHTRLEKVRILPDDFERFRKFQEEVTKHYRVWVAMKPTTELADAPALEALLALTPGDGKSAAVLARLYLANEKGAEARRVLARACHYRPAEKGLWELNVQAAAGAEEEEAVLREMVRRFSGEAKYAVTLGQVLVDRGDHAGARAVLQPVIDKGGRPDRAQAHLELARSSLLQDEPAAALKHVEAAAEADADSVATAEGEKLRGSIHEKLGNTDEARAAYLRASELEPQSPEPLEALVRLALEANQPADALDFLRRYTVAVGKDRDGLVQAADFHLRLGRLDDALDLATRARRQGPAPEADRVLGLVRLRRNDPEQALKHLARAEADGEVLGARIRALLALGRLREAARQAKEAEKIEDPPPELEQLREITARLLKRRATVLKAAHAPAGREREWRTAVDGFVCAEQAYEEGKSVADVQKLLNRGLPDGLESGPAFGLRGLLALEKGRLADALADAERAIALSPAEARGHYVRGRVRLERGIDGALEDLKRAAELSERKDAGVLHWLAAALARRGNSEDALAAERAAAKLNPGDEEIQAQLKALEKGAGRAGR
jgi:tetratricopeptide (TPR) repeat protein